MNKETAVKLVFWLVDVREWSVSWDKKYDFYGLWHWDKNTCLVDNNSSKQQIKVIKRCWPFGYSIIFLEEEKNYLRIDGHFKNLFEHLTKVINEKRAIKLEDWK